MQLEWDDAKRRLTLQSDPRMKNWPGGVRGFQIELAGGNVDQPVEFLGAPVEIDF